MAHRKHFYSKGRKREQRRRIRPKQDRNPIEQTLNLVSPSPGSEPCIGMM
jgi:hypothetical protein